MRVLAGPVSFELLVLFDLYTFSKRKLSPDEISYGVCH